MSGSTSAIWNAGIAYSSSVAMLAFALRLQLPHGCVICLVLFYCGFLAYGFLVCTFRCWAGPCCILRWIGLHTFCTCLLLLYCQAVQKQQCIHPCWQRFIATRLYGCFYFILHTLAVVQHNITCYLGQHRVKLFPHGLPHYSG